MTVDTIKSGNRMNSLRVQRLPTRGGRVGRPKTNPILHVEGSGSRKCVPEATLPAEGRQLVTRPVSWLGVRPRARLPAEAVASWAVVPPHSCGAAPDLNRLPEHRVRRRSYARHRAQSTRAARSCTLDDSA